MVRQKAGKSSIKEKLMVAFVLVGSLLVMADVGKNIADETRLTSEFETLSTEPATPQPQINSTLSEEEMKRWADHMK